MVSDNHQFGGRGQKRRLGLKKVAELVADEGEIFKLEFN
jgi:hypothetical protein